MKDLTRGPLRPHLLRMSGAMFLNMLTGVLFSLVNIYWLGRMGAQAQAAVSMAGIPMMLLLTLMPIIGTGAGIRIAHAVGANDRARANRIFNEAFGASLIGIALIGAVAWAWRDRFGALLTTDAGTVALVGDYFQWFVPSVVVQLPLMVMAIALQFTGDVRAGTIAQSATVVLNAILAPVLMFGWLGMPALGVTGTGLASFLACAVAMLGLLVYVLRARSYLRMQPSVWWSRPRELWGALKIGLPTGIEGGVVALYMLALALLLRPFGPDQQAAFGVGQRVFQALLLPLMALSSAVCIVVGQCHGAGLGPRVRATLRSGIGLCLLVAPVLVVVVEVFAPRICGAFSDDPRVIAAAALFLRIAAITLVPSACAYLSFAVLSGMGNTRASLYTQLVHVGLVVLPAFALSRVPGFQPVWIWTVMAGAGIVQALMAWYFLRRAFAPGSAGATDAGAGPRPAPAGARDGATGDDAPDGGGLAGIGLGVTP